MQSQVAIAEAEPRLAAEGGNRLERLPRLAGAAPAALLVVHAGQRVKDGVEIRGDVESEYVDVVSHVADDRDGSRADQLNESAYEPRAADAAR
jgi:hypothetical protein